MCVSQLSYAHLWGRFIFIMWVSNTLDSWKILRTPLRSWGLPFKLSLSVFSRGGSKFPGKYDVTLHASCWGYSARSSWNYSLLLTGIRSSDRSSGCVVVGFCTLLSLRDRGSKSYRKDCFATASNIMEILLPAFRLCHFVTEKGLMGFLLFSTIVFLCSHLSSCSMRGRELNRGNRRMLLLIFFKVLLPTYLVT